MADVVNAVYAQAKNALETHEKAALLARGFYGFGIALSIYSHPLRFSAPRQQWVLREQEMFSDGCTERRSVAGPQCQGGPYSVPRRVP